MLIWGFRTTTNTLGQGTFFCPYEGIDQTYSLKRAKRWFTFFFIPLFPTRDSGEYAECAGCLNTYSPEVIQSRKRGIGYARPRGTISPTSPMNLDHQVTTKPPRSGKRIARYEGDPSRGFRGFGDTAA